MDDDRKVVELTESLKQSADFWRSCSRSMVEPTVSRALCASVADEAELAAGEIARLHREVEVLIAYHVQPWRYGGGWAVRLPSEPGWTGAGYYLGDGMYFFDDRDAAVAAYRRAAGLDVGKTD